MVFYVQGKLLFSLDIAASSKAHHLAVSEPDGTVAYVAYHIKIHYKALEKVLEPAIEIALYLTPRIVYGNHFASGVYLRLSVVCKNVDDIRYGQYPAAPSVYYRNVVTHIIPPLP